MSYIRLRAQKGKSSGLARYSEKQAFIASFGAGFLLVLLVFFGFRLFQADYLSRSTTQTNPEVLAVSQENESFAEDAGIDTLGILLIGYGGAGHQGGYLTDALQVMYLDFKKKKLALLSIPRDLWVSLPDGRNMKINSVMTTYGRKPDLIGEGAKSLKSVVSSITGLRINYFIAVDFVGFQRAIGINLGGIEVEVEEMLDDPWYPIQGEELNTCGMTPDEVADVSQKYSGFELEKQFPCRYERLYFEKGIVHMEGGDALKYVRSRHGSSEGDISRGRRQQEVFMAIVKKLFSLDALNDIDGFYKTLSEHVRTDIDLELAKYIGPLLFSFKDIKEVRINLSTASVLSLSTAQGGQSILLPKEGAGKFDKIRLFIKNQL